MKHRFTAFFLAGLLAGTAGAAQAQCTEQTRVRLSFDDARGDLLRAAAIRGALERTPMFFYREQDEHLVCLDSIPLLRDWVPPRDSTMFEILAPSSRFTIHTEYPRERNNGGLVETVGLNAAVDFGIAARWKWFSAVFAPRLTYQQNDFFPVPETNWAGRSQWANPYHFSIDLPKRFGSSGWSEFQWGATRIQAEYGPVSAGFSTANMWVGSTRLFPLMMSNTAPGFPHAFVSVRPFSAWITDIEINSFWGQVSESDYFDGDVTNDQHVITGFQVGFAPHFIPGLQFGFARVYHDVEDFGEAGIGGLLEMTWDSPFFTGGGNRRGNAIGFLYGRFVLPESGFEVFGEWSREDTPYNLEDIFREPDWTQAYALGFQKLIQHDRSMSSFWGELVHLGLSKPTFLGHGDFSMYTHNAVRQGHTHRGQILGAAVGPGSDAQTLGFDHYRQRSRAGIFIERTRYDDDTYYRYFSRRYGEARHQVELTIGGNYLHRLGAFEVEGGVNWSMRYDRDFMALVVADPPKDVQHNWNPWFRVSWRPELVAPLLP